MKIIHFDVNDGNRVSEMVSILDLVKPIESLFFSPRHKCFTFFNHEQDSFKLIIKKINIVIYSAWQAIPYSNINMVYLAIHSPNIMPNKDSFIPMNLSLRLDLVYTKFQYYQLPSYSGCIHYMGNFDTFKTQSDCIFDCQKRFYTFDCIAEFFYNQEFPIRSDQLPNEQPNTTCNWSSLGNIHPFKIREICMSKCPDECYHVYYLLQTKDKRLYKAMISMPNTIHVNLIQKNFPTIIIKQLPEMSIISLLCNIGGLLGMWLGVSLLSTFNNIYNTSKNVFCKLFSNISYNKNNISNFIIINHNNNNSVNN